MSHSGPTPHTPVSEEDQIQTEFIVLQLQSAVGCQIVTEEVTGLLLVAFEHKHRIDSLILQSDTGYLP